METILIGRDRKTGKWSLLAGPDISFPQQNEKYRAYAGPENDEFDVVRLDYLQPCKKPLKFTTRAEATAEAAEPKAETPATAQKSQGKKPKAN